jgi:hypothetical protein
MCGIVELFFKRGASTEVAAGCLTRRLGQGMRLPKALEAALADLDGFYTFAVGTGDGFAIIEIQSPASPAVLAESDDW